MYRSENNVVKTYDFEEEFNLFARVAREVRLLKELAKLQCSHIQQLAGESNFVVITKFAGLPLSLCKNRDPATLANYLAQVCQALQAAQKKKICHGDIHPDNIAVEDEGKGGDEDEQEEDEDEHKEDEHGKGAHKSKSKGEVTLLDWELAVEHNTTSRNVTGSLAFASERWLKSIGEMEYSHCYHDDLESLAYPYQYVIKFSLNMILLSTPSYVALYYFTKNMWWRGLQDPREILQRREDVHCPQLIYQYLRKISVCFCLFCATDSHVLLC